MRFVSYDTNGLLHAISEAHRWAVFDSTHRVVRKHLVPEGNFFWLHAQLLANEQLLVSGTVFDAEHFGYSIHRLGHNKKVDQSMALDSTTLTPQIDSKRVLALGKNGFWAARQLQYEITDWSYKGAARTTWRRQEAWFPGRTAVFVDTMSAPPARIMDIQEDENGLLWILIVIADAQWSNNVARIRSTPAEQRWGEHQLADLYDSVLEVVNPNCGKIVASARLPHFLNGLLDSRLATGWEYLATGRPVMTLWRLDAKLQPASECG